MVRKIHKNVITPKISADKKWVALIKMAFAKKAPIIFSEEISKIKFPDETFVIIRQLNEKIFRLFEPQTKADVLV